MDGTLPGGTSRGGSYAGGRTELFTSGVVRNVVKADVASLVEGQNATLRLLSKAFEKAQIAEVNPAGAAFDHTARRVSP